MPQFLNDVGRTVANWMVKFKALKGKKHEAVLTVEEAGIEPEMPSKSLLHFISPKWIDNESLADTNSTVTRAKHQVPAPQPSSSVHAIGDPSHQTVPRHNDAVQYVHSIPDTRSEVSLYYLENSRLGSPKQERILYEQGHGYRYGDPRAQPVDGNVFPVTEVVHPDWHAHALGRLRAGYWSMQDFSEQHLADRLFHNAQIIPAAEHLRGSQKAAVQELQAACMLNSARRGTSSTAIAKAEHFEHKAQALQMKVQEVEKEVEAMRSLLDTES